jgi:hypothetical protein
MAHKIKIEPRAHQNRDGSLSATKKDYVVIDRTRGKRVEVGVEGSQKAAQGLVESYREQLVADQKKHPNDTLHRIKHGGF